MLQSWNKWQLLETLSLPYKGKTLKFIEFTTPEERAQGLMHREQPLGNNTGGLFIYDEAERLSFWMKNTHVPLDIIFIDENGIVSDIHRNTKPYSEEPIKSSKPCKYAMEFDAGQVDLLGFRENESVF
tara:strand:- start:1820 stop:2203 length:384 start_codon:yes stop_codon:yes gene_type:complete